ncbi:MAG: dihydrolipoyl dehydrogenase [bacterium]|nr:dihydrolipoyl dehydrogenase [bacterium]
MRKVKIAILGAGTAGLSAQRTVARQTEDYVVIDPGPLGTTCARVGCMPSKGLLHTARLFHRIREGGPGIGDTKKISLETSQVMAHVRKLRDHFVGGVLRDQAKWQEAHWIPKRAKFLSPNTLDVEGEELEAESVIIATGSHPVLPQAWQDYQTHLVDTDSFFELPSLPNSMAVIGLGPVGFELGQALHYLGVEVVGFDQVRTVAGFTDPELQNYAVAYFTQEMNLNFEAVELTGTDENSLTLATGKQKYHVAKALVAVGRSPNVTDLGLETLGVPLDDKGMPSFDSTTLQVGDLPIFIAGDVNGTRPILHEAADEGRIAAFNALQDDAQCFERRVPLQITFSRPQCAMVGMTFDQLRDQGIDFCIGETKFDNQGRAKIMGLNHGLLRVYANKKDGKLLGAELMAPQGEHLAHLIAWAIALNQTASDLLRMPFYHPVVEEGLRSAIRDAAKKCGKELSFAELMRCEDNPVL